MRQTSEPERTRSLPNRYLNLGYENLAMRSLRDLGRGGCLEKERKCLNQVGSRLFNRRTLARNIELRAQRHETIVLAFDDRGQSLRRFHDPSLHWYVLDVPCTDKEELGPLTSPVILKKAGLK